MTTPRTVAGQAWLSGTRPFVRRALTQTIVAIQDEAIAPYAEALRDVDRALESLAARDRDPTRRNHRGSISTSRRRGAHRLAGLLLAQEVEGAIDER